MKRASITFNDRAEEAVETVMLARRLDFTEAVNHSVALAAMVEEELANGRRLAFVDEDGSNVEFIRIL